LVGSVLDPDGLHAMRWTEAKGLVRLGPGVAMAVSGDGSTVVGKNANGACLWNVNGRVTALTSNDGDQAEAVSRDGTVVAGTTARFRAFRWTARDGLRLLGPLPGGKDWTEAHGISGDGAVIVGTASKGHPLHNSLVYVACMWTRDGSAMALREGARGFPYQYFASHALAASHDGAAIAGYVGDAGSDPWNQPFRWTKPGWFSGGRITGLGYPATIHKPGASRALAISADGGVIVGYTGNFHDGETPFIWTRKWGMQDLRELLRKWNVAGAQPSGHAAAVSADGRTIVGRGSHYVSGVWRLRLAQ
jgi:uncharacterized membrane protein